ncbi:MAG: sigma-70 family RNA polymerase sigma factor [Candidatus Eisenbacteria bacterium]|uniref:Sigma-70 family RNA polymerase sigma factor n=1 Tax=Eiseniibacteriota bacterium TaxID=2212470 RepID=A0A948WEZ6_UNCEI|nr:sigma-70 family RNA polymerase sigma factor [Candidatus Eisenbacteria bacterium]MBU1950569.1 sigma-70 family RNA polymerase sigma factor [Candidatus Eisenbacteria bacterium]MBU2693233.1 sigma-70 family RNA polymerase sigma factor [Candidatus Eisenbacteria bacterium]
MTGNELSHSGCSLEVLCARAREGDSQSESLFFEDLRVRFHSIAKRRVRADDVDDVIQDAIQIVHRKYKDLEISAGILVWSLTVLRNVIGNYYQAKRREGRQMSHDDQTLEIREPLAVSLWDEKWRWAEQTSGLIERIADAIQALSQNDQRCGKIMKGVLKSIELGGGQREVSQRAMGMIHEDFPFLSRASYHVALHRCRARLRALLIEMEGNLQP